jgi:hypothetical protein
MKKLFKLFKKKHKRNLLKEELHTALHTGNLKRIRQMIRLGVEINVLDLDYCKDKTTLSKVMNILEKEGKRL